MSKQLMGQVQYRIALVLPRSKTIVVERHSGTPQLPRINISTSGRPAEQLTNKISKRWGIHSIVIDYLSEQSASSRCVLMEALIHNQADGTNGLTFVCADDLSDAELAQGERKLLHHIIAGDTDDRGPFSRIGWLKEAQRWLRESTHDRALDCAADVLQLNASGSFALIRFATRSGHAYWLKATGVPNAHELLVTSTLATLFPRFLPTVVATRNDWNAWITEDIGQPLHNKLTLPTLEHAVKSLADLQMHSIPYVETLIAAGCTDRRIMILKGQLDVFIDFLQLVMVQQTSQKVLPLSKIRLREIGSLLDDACAKMQELGIPDTLIHNDINPGNILISGEHCVFIDWAEAFVGNPLFTFEHLLVYLKKATGESQLWTSRLTTVYKRRWLDYLSEETLEKALALAPFLAIAAYLCGRGAWLSSPASTSPEFRSYARSLARRLDRAAQVPSLRKALCD